MASTLTTPDPSTGPGARDDRRRWLALVAVAAVVALAGVIAAVVVADDDESAGPPLELSTGAGDAMASCLAPDATILGAMPVAFAGTATAVEGERVTLEVDQWYTDGDAETVELQSMGGQVALTAGFDFVAGDRYLVSADRGTVAFCGLSGPATPELQSLYDDAFAG